MSINVLDLLKKTSIQPRKASSTNGGEYHSPCPGCGDLSRAKASDRFQVWPDRKEGSGYYICRKCGKHGDNIQFLIDFENMTFPEACRELDIKLKNNTHLAKTISTPKPPQRMTKGLFQPENKAAPCKQWLDQAEPFVKFCQDSLLTNDSALKWLADRGITRESVITYRLGWNPGKAGKDLYKSRKAWGLPLDKNEKTGKIKSLWLPVGWVIPLFDDQKRVIQLRIRRTEHDMQSFLPDLKYLVVAGSTMATMVINPKAKAFVVVEAGLDAILVAQEGDNPDVGAVTTWNATAKPDATATAILKKSLSILISLDSDKGGLNGSKWWTKYFSQAKRWPVPKGKDPGDAFTAGVDINSWIHLGLPPVLTLFRDQEKDVDHQHFDHGMISEEEGENCNLPQSNNKEPLPEGNLLHHISKLPHNFQIAWAFLSAHLPELLANGWSREELFRRSSKTGPFHDIGLAWIPIWGNEKLKVSLAEKGQIQFAFLSATGRHVTQSAWPKSYFIRGGSE